MERFLLVTDTPGIKQFVFGTDSLAEVRGASAILDRLNRQETERILCEALPSGETLKVFANGGSSQFVINADRVAVQQAIETLASTYRDATGDDARIVWGLVPFSGSYKEANSNAHVQMRTWRETESANRCVPLLPFVHECPSASHLPSETKLSTWGDEAPRLLSAAVAQKYKESRQSRRRGIWPDWMEYLERGGSWPDENRWPKLRAEGAADFEGLRKTKSKGARRGYVGLVYADGNAMGRLVQELDEVETCAAFSRIVDDAIREACHYALSKVCATEIAAIREGRSKGPLPADILLLGGDDLLVLLPADLALEFSLIAMEQFERLTREKIAALTGPAREFFQSRGVENMTISCGVAFAQASYPFYLLLDLAEDLLKSAKQGGSRAVPPGYHAPAFIDFHLVVGAAGADLKAVRESDYLVGVKDNRPRTLRPYSSDRMRILQHSARQLQKARPPRSKLQDLWQAALTARHPLATARCRELFSRLRQDDHHSERRSLWDALTALGMNGEFPWCGEGNTATALADLIEAYDLFPREETP